MTPLVVDTSAIAAILLEELDAGSLGATLRAHSDRRISDLTAFELQVVMHRRWGAAGAMRALRFLQGISVSRVPFDQSVSDEAVAAYQRYGKGGGHRAQLNVCACAAYATAKVLSAPLLYKGLDFSYTDVMRPTP